MRRSPTPPVLFAPRWLGLNSRPGFRREGSAMRGGYSAALRHVGLRGARTFVDAREELRQSVRTRGRRRRSGEEHSRSAFRRPRLGRIRGLLWPSQGLTVSLGGRIDGIPARDVVGGGEGGSDPERAIDRGARVVYMHD